MNIIAVITDAMCVGTAWALYIIMTAYDSYRGQTNEGRSIHCM